MKNLIQLSILLLFIGLLSCENDIDSSGSAGTGGSLARFTIAKNALYTVSPRELKVFNITTVDAPVQHSTERVSFGAETLFPLDDLLFMGTETGMAIYDISTPLSPNNISWFSHVRSCDPVVSDGKYAYITLRSSESRCSRGEDELQIVDIGNVSNPVLVGRLSLEAPKGLALKNEKLYICDNGLKLVDVSDKSNPTLLNTIYDIQANDIIINNNIAIVLGDNEINQYKIENGELSHLSTISTGLQ